MNNRSIPCLLSAIVLASCSPGDMHAPISNAAQRATPLSFGLYVTPDPANNPIEPPERFSGYHTAVDYEVSAGELEGDVPVYAICTGQVAYSGFAGGYGGLLVQRCKIMREEVTVLYGHLDLENLPSEGEYVTSGDTIGLLGANRSYDTDGNRKHLHLAIHKGSRLDLRGYVQNEVDLEEYIDPLTVLPMFTIDLPGDSPGEVPFWQTEEEDT